jgi:hypothetical protein
VLRSTLGTYEGHETIFANTVQCSVSWVKKVSSGKRELTTNTAHKVASATGVSEEWLLRNDPKMPIVETDNFTPYTLESYLRWREHRLQSTTMSAPKQGDYLVSPAQFIQDILEALAAAGDPKRQHTAMNDLWKFSKVMKARYGQPIDPERTADFTLQTLDEAHSLVRAALERYKRHRFEASTAS